MRTIAVLVVNVIAFVKAFWHRAMVLLPEPNGVRFAAAIFKTFPFRGLERFERIIGGFPALVMERAPFTSMNDFSASFHFAYAPRCPPLNRANLGFQWVASCLKS